MELVQYYLPADQGLIFRHQWQGTQAWARLMFSFTINHSASLDTISLYLFLYSNSSLLFTLTNPIPAAPSTGSAFIKLNLFLTINTNSFLGVICKSIIIQGSFV